MLLLGSIKNRPISLLSFYTLKKDMTREMEMIFLKR
jgi:hypothetical protein